MYYPEIVYPQLFVVFKQWPWGAMIECAFLSRNDANAYVNRHNNVIREEDSDTPERYTDEVWWESTILR